MAFWHRTRLLPKTASEVRMLTNYAADFEDHLFSRVSQHCRTPCIQGRQLFLLEHPYSSCIFCAPPESLSLHDRSSLIASPPFPEACSTTTNTCPSPPQNPLFPPQPCSTPHPCPITWQWLQLIIRIFLRVALQRRADSRVGVLLFIALSGTVIFVGSNVFGGERYGCWFAAEHCVLLRSRYGSGKRKDFSRR